MAMTRASRARDPAEKTRGIATICWFANIVHPSFQRTMPHERFAEGEAAQAVVKGNRRKSFKANCQEIDSMFQGKEWVMGSELTLVDLYALVSTAGARR